MKKLLFSLFFCAVSPLFAADGKPFTVVTTFTVIADMAQNVAGNDAKVVSITKPGAEIHDVEPMSIHGGEYDGKPNPHAWMSVENAKIYVKNIEAALAKHDPAHAEHYHQNAAAYLAKLEAMDAKLKEDVAKIPEAQRWLVSSEGAFSYLARDLGFKEAYLWPINAEQQGTPQQVSALIETVRANQIPVVFSESTISDKPAKQVAKESGARYGGVLYVDSLSAADGPVPTYLDLLKVTTDTVINGFQH